MKSTPQAARKLLHLFASGLIIAVIAGSLIYLRAVFNQEVSQRRSVMNEAVFNAQDFFVSRQTLLKSLVLAAVPDKPGHAPFISVDPEEETSISLGSENDRWNLWLTQRMVEHLSESKVSLLYVSQAQDPEVFRLFNTTSHLRPVPKEILQRLEDEASKWYSLRDDLWLTDKMTRVSPMFFQNFTVAQLMALA